MLAEQRVAAANGTRKVLFIVLLLNIVVAGAKLVTGTLTGSIAILADGYHSLFDSLATVVGLLGVTLASRPPDRDHHYGHQRYEVVAALVIAMFLVLAAWEVLGAAIYRYRTGSAPAADLLSFVVMISTMLINIGVTTWEHRAGERLHSRVLKTDASHTRSDVYASLAVICALVAVRLGHAYLDVVVAFAIGMLIARTAYVIIRDALMILSDAAPIGRAEITALFPKNGGLGEIHAVRSRSNGSEVFVDLHVYLPNEMSVQRSHEITETVETRIKSAYPDVKDVVVHVEPESQKLRDRES
ncbi:MAG: cation diffusion facilitator family transporter [Candidatus Binatia bacterium]